MFSMRRGLLALTVMALLGLALVWGVYAQEPKPERDGPGAQGIGGAGLADPPPPGYSVLYMFSGVRDADPGTTYATVIHCTNYGQTAANVTVQLFDYDGDQFGVTKSIPKNYTRTFTTRDTLIYQEDYFFTLTDDLDQGSGRVLSDKTSVICTAQVVDAVHSPPAFVVRLPLYNANGQLIDVNRRKGYVPVMIRE